ncbi:4f2aa248-1b98-46f1-bd83-81f0d01ba671 [Sclerotinia trifoliorum]|uniref:4f2aa248-1b98-46f1-bd83-81f0d01ba671 n=1 Tax=Sclerotinia trifoliorum TaxID=28548 RepID=A0A8H2ZQ28_9HELO|nr:4f2aa248-1b98-46f1-bd83-81f0d01ba671 [Sclerotinia trifoliorum]
MVIQADNWSILTVPRPLAALLLIAFNVIIDDCINDYHKHKLDIWFFTQRSYDPDMQMDKQDQSSAVKGDFSRLRSSSTVARSPTGTTLRSFNLVPLMRTANQQIKLTENMPLDIRLQAIKLCFGLGNPHAEQWPGVYIVNVYGRFGNRFKILLGEEFDVIWRIMEREKPTEAFEIW